MAAVTVMYAATVDRTLVRTITEEAHQRLRGPNIRPLPSQRSIRNRHADTQARANVRPRANGSRGQPAAALGRHPGQMASQRT